MTGIAAHVPVRLLSGLRVVWSNLLPHPHASTVAPLNGREGQACLISRRWRFAMSLEWPDLLSCPPFRLGCAKATHRFADCNCAANQDISTVSATVDMNVTRNLTPGCPPGDESIRYLTNTHTFSCAQSDTTDSRLRVVTRRVLRTPHSTQTALRPWRCSADCAPPTGWPWNSAISRAKYSDAGPKPSAHRGLTIALTSTEAQSTYPSCSPVSAGRAGAGQ